MTQGGADVTLAAFLREAELDVEDVYQGSKSWSDLRGDAGLSILPAGPQEAVLRRACGRILHVDDPLQIDTYRRFLGSTTSPEVRSLAERDRRLLRMLVASIADSAITATTSLQEACELVWEHPQVLYELSQLMEVLDLRVSHVQHGLDSYPDVPLRVHARYTRIDILAAFGIGANARVSPWQTGVYWAKEVKADLFAFTLDKTSGQFSPTTRYNDYAINRDLIHWQSQSATREDSDTGRRYRNHVAVGTSILLFARLRTDDRAFWFLGPATYVKHESETPMSVTWRLKHPLPGDLFEQFAAAVA
jgi:hypothetical protein